MTPPSIMQAAAIRPGLQVQRRRSPTPYFRTRLSMVMVIPQLFHRPCSVGPSSPWQRCLIRGGRRSTPPVVHDDHYCRDIGWRQPSRQEHPGCELADTPDRAVTVEVRASCVPDVYPRTRRLRIGAARWKVGTGDEKGVRISGRVGNHHMEVPLCGRPIDDENRARKRGALWRHRWRRGRHLSPAAAAATPWSQAHRQRDGKARALRPFMRHLDPTSSLARVRRNGITSYFFL